MDAKTGSQEYQAADGTVFTDLEEYRKVKGRKRGREEGREKGLGEG